MDIDTLTVYESGSKIDNSADTISSFIADWVQIKYFYSEAASLAQDLCETLLASNAIRAIVTHRVKQGHRLEAKLRERVRKLGREYRSAKEIRDDVVDLAGVRIALYFPSDREKIDKIIHDAFTEVKHKSFPEQDNKKLSDSLSVVTEKASEFEQRFHGYSADHYCVRMRVENLATKKLRDDFQKTNPAIEIQVASVLMHAWAEIDHDLVYKTLTSGPASQQELRLLDATNGLVHTGEVLLQQLQTAMDDRVAYQNKPFSEQYELLSFLRGQIKNAKGSMEHLDVLLLVLKITRLDSPRKLGETLEGFVIPAKSNAPIVLIILEHILCSLGEEQRRTNNLYLRPKSVLISDLEVDNTNPKCYSTDVETRDRVLDQRDILEMTVSVTDIMRFPEKSILVVEGMPQKFRKFYALYNLVHFATVRPMDPANKDSEKWLCEISLRELDPLWTWFEINEDVLFRVSLLLARMNVEEIDQELIKLRPSSGFQRLPAAHEPNFGYTSPCYFTPRSGDTESRFSKIPEELETPKSGPRGGNEKSPPDAKNQESLSKPSRRIENESRLQRNEMTSPAAPEEAKRSDTEDEDEKDNAPTVAPERAMRLYTDSKSKQEAKRRFERISTASVPKKRAPKSVRRQSRGSTASVPEERIHKAKPSMPERRTSTQYAYIEGDTSEDSNEEPRKPVVVIQQDGSRQAHRPRSPPMPTRRHYIRDTPTASSPGEYAMAKAPEAPEPPEAGAEEDLGEEIRRQYGREYNEYQKHIRNETASTLAMPAAIEAPRPRRGDTGPSRRNGYYRSNQPALMARFEPSSSKRIPRLPSEPFGSPRAPRYYQYPLVPPLIPPYSLSTHQMYGYSAPQAASPGNWPIP